MKFFVLKIIKDPYFKKKLRRDIVDPLNIWLVLSCDEKIR